jgi:tyrosyl-tRNA synthetase
MVFGNKIKIITDEVKIDEFLTRSVEKVYPNADFLKKTLLSGKQLSFYLGIDPTGPSIHLGHMIPMLALSRLQKLGHKITLLMGDFTAMIGDPDKSSAREPLTKKQVLANLKDYKKQASRIIDFKGKNKANIVFNSKWLSKMNFEDVLSLASKMTLQQMIERDMFDKRIKEGKPVYLHEFMYPLMQGYDSVALKTDGEIGGNDQTFNMLTGRNLEKEILGKEKFVMTTKLLTDSSGKKMGKSEGNMAALSDKPTDVFGKVMSWGDGVIVSALEYCTVLPMPEIEKSKENLAKGLNPRDEKKKLAYAITELCFGTKEAKGATEAFEKTFQKKEVPEEVPEIVVGVGGDVVANLIEKGFVSSKTELRRLATAGAITEITKNKKITQEEVMMIKDGVYKIGKHRFVKIIIKQ